MAERIFYSHLNIDENEIRKAVLELLSSDPSSPTSGRIWFNTGEGRIKFYDGSQILSASGDIEDISAGSNKISITNGDGPSPSIDVNPGNIDHQNLSNVGTNTHSDIDTHIASTSNPHQVSLEQARTQNNVLSGSIDMGGNAITGVSDPTNDQDAATKIYVDNLAQGIDSKESVRAATTQDLGATASGSGVGKTLSSTQNEVLTVDTINTWTDIDNDGASKDPFDANPADRVLVKNEENSADNGVYAVKDKGEADVRPWVLVRAADADEDDEVTAGLYVFVTEGENNSDSGFILVSDDAITVDTDNQSFVQFTGAGQITAGSGLTKTGNTIDFNSADNSLVVNADDVSVNVDGSTLETDATNGIQIKASGVTETELNTSAVGTGLTGGAGTPVSVVGYTPVSGTTVARKYLVTGINIGDTPGPQTINHGLGTRGVNVTVYRSSSPYDELGVVVEHTDTDNVTIDANGDTRTVDVVVTG